MAKNIFDSLKNLFKGRKVEEVQPKENGLRVNLILVEKRYEEDNIVESAIILKHLLEIYGNQKKKNNRFKGREFVHFILSNKHKDLKNIGYNHWEKINKIIHLNQAKSYPYHKENLRKAIDFFKKELKGIKAIDMEV